MEREAEQLSTLQWIFERRRKILDETYKRITAQLSGFHKDNYEAYEGEVVNGNLRADIEVINQDGSPADQRAAFLHIYGLDHDDVKDKVNNDNNNQEMMGQLFHLCNIRGTAQLYLPFSLEGNREEIENICQACDELISSWDKSSTVYWHRPDVKARIDDIDDRMTCTWGLSIPDVILEHVYLHLLPDLPSNVIRKDEAKKAKYVGH